LLQTDNHANTSPLSFFTGQMPFLPPNQQRQSTEGIKLNPMQQNQTTRKQQAKFYIKTQTTSQT